MKVYPVEGLFLTRGEQALRLPSGARAVGIHPSSEIDRCFIDGQELSVGGLVQPGGVARPIHAAPGTFNNGASLSERLVLQVFEAGDELVPVQARGPVVRQAYVLDADLQAAAATARCVIRLPFWGRAMAVLRFKREAAIDLNVVILGITWGVRGQPRVNTMIVEKAAETWFTAGVAPVETVGDPGGFCCKQVYVGGEGDGGEAYDELAVFAYGAGGAIGSSFSAEAFGERAR